MFNFYNCAEKPCCRSFDSLYSFTKHFKSKHPDLENESALSAVCNKTVDNSAASGSAGPSINENFESADAVAGVSLSKDVFIGDTSEKISLDPEDMKEAVFSHSLRFVSKLYSKPGIPRNHVQTISEEVTDLQVLSNGFIPVVRQAVTQVFSENNIDPSASS